MLSRFVLLHGFTGAPASWDGVRACLPAGTRALCPALVGHAPCTGPARDFIAEVDRLAAVIDASGWSGSHLCGYSLGARVALGLLVRHPSLFASATLIGVHPGLPEEGPGRAGRVAMDEAWACLAERHPASEFFDKWSAQPLFASQRGLPAEVRAGQDAIRAKHDGSALAEALRAMSLARMPDWRPSLVALAAPVRLMAGELDGKFAGLAREMVGLIPNAAVTIVPNAGHNLPLERPGEVAAALISPL